MKIAFAASEAVPYSKTGGLADVAGSLPKALENLGCEVMLFTPMYLSVDPAKYNLKLNEKIGIISFTVAGHNRSIQVFTGRLPGSSVEVFLVDSPHYFHRDEIYTDGCDEDERFILFNKSVLEILQRLQLSPDIIHCNDWQTALLPLYMRENYGWDKLFEKTASVFTIHNIGYQGRFAKDTLGKAEIDPKLFFPGGPVEFNGDILFMKSALLFSDIINTVSRTYAKEILTPEYGAGLQDVLKEREADLFGILNGIDYSEWDPASDRLIPYNFNPNDLSGKLKNKERLLEKFKLRAGKGTAVIGMVSRMATQKGFDIFAEASDELMSLDARWIVLGSGEKKYESMFKKLTEKYPEKITVHIGYDNELAHLVEAGSDMFLMPSHYEPCGLNQIYSLKYGTVPIVRKTGGLADTVFDRHEARFKNREASTGFTFSDYTGQALMATVKRALGVFKDKDTWDGIVQNCMKQDYSWDMSAIKYLELYNVAAEKRTTKP